MDLVKRVCTELGIEKAKAETGLAAVFTSVRTAVDSTAWQEIKKLLPEAQDLIAKTPIGGGRTGELLALVGPGAIDRSLSAASFEDSEATKLIALVGGILQDGLTAEVTNQISSRLPDLRLKYNKQH